jgi:Transcriptional regulators
MAIVPEQVARDLLETAPLVVREIRSEMRSQSSTELTVPQFRTLNFVDKNPGTSLLEVANHLGLTPPSTSRLVDGLIERGLVSREDHPLDRRRLRLDVTNDGQKILEKARKGTIAHLANKLSCISADDRETISKAMKALQLIFGPAAQTESRSK